MMKGKDRNAACWCGSGIKYKKCHLGREQQSIENPWAAVEANRKAFTQKKCCADGVGLGVCNGGVIKAHTVSRGANLAKIAKDGHVLQYATSIPEMRKNGRKLSIKKVGIKEASVFYGFFRKHDQELFSCIENEPFAARPNQCLAVAYRTMSRELYGKDAVTHLRETLRGADKGKPLFEQILMQNWLDHVNLGNEAALRDGRAIHSALTKALVNRETEFLTSLIFEFNEHLPFMLAGAWSPFTDLYGKELQDGLELDNPVEQIFFSSFALESKSKICISWKRIDRTPAKVIAEQLQALPSNLQASACLQVAAKHIENLFYNSDWYERLTNEQQNQLDILTSSGVDFLGSVPTAPIRLDLDYKLPPCSKYF